MSDEQTTDDVLGRHIDLPDGRVVFLGQSKKHPENRYVAFKNAEGRDTKLVLSAEALNALKKLLTSPMTGMPLATFPHRFEWRLVKDGESL